MTKLVKKKRASRVRKTAIVGREGKLRFGLSMVKVVVLEDRGPLGHNGRRLLRVRFADPTDDPSSSFEIRAEDLELKPSR